MGYGIVDAINLGSEDEKGPTRTLSRYRQIAFLGVFISFAAFILSLFITDMDVEASGQ